MATSCVPVHAATTMSRVGLDMGAELLPINGVILYHKWVS